jgi:membrane associated rhomboid family serine protease
MLFLWVYGRALEDTLGPLIYLGAYLLAGIAATLMYHVITMQFTPHSAGIPLMGASGAIAGVMGLFAVRFYRTPVRMFYILPTTIPIFVIASIIASIGWYMVVRESLTSGLLGLASAAAFIFFYGRTWAWGNFMAPSAMIIGGWILISNVIPGVRKLFETEKSGGVAYWAHIGGFAFGMVYALLIGSQAEGGKEYMLEDAQKAYDNADMKKAVECAENLLVREPNNAGAYEVLAKAYDRQGNEEAALDNYELAIDQYLKKGERDAAVSAYLAALHKHERFILPPDKQLAVGNQMAKNGDFQNSSETLVKIPYTFPDAPESEISLLRSAQLYLEHLGQPQMTMQLLEYFVHRYPQSQWMPQVERAYRVAQYQVAGPQEQPQEASFTGPEPEVPRQRPQAVLSSDFLPPKR